jgi:6-phosphogluconolactonase
MSGTAGAAGLRSQIALHPCVDLDALAAAVAEAFADAVRRAVADRGHAAVVLTGGRTPRAYYPLFRALDLPWEHVTLTLSDERWVGSDHVESNERLLRESLLVGRAAAARLVPLKNDAADPYAGCAAAARILGTLPASFDLVLLGVGADTHVASLFPGAAEFDQGVCSDEPCIAVTPPAGVVPALPRLSLTLNRLLASRRIVLAATGEDKRAAFEQAVAGHWPLPSPVHLIAKQAQQPVDFFWTP